MEEKNVTIPNEASKSFGEGLKNGYAEAQERVERFVKGWGPATNPNDIVAELKAHTPIVINTTEVPELDLLCLIERIQEEGPPPTRELLIILEHIHGLIVEGEEVQS